MHVIVTKEPKFSFRSSKYFNIDDNKPLIYYSNVSYEEEINMQEDNYVTKRDVLEKCIKDGEIDYNILKQCPHLLLQNLKHLETNLQKIKPHV